MRIKTENGKCSVNCGYFSAQTGCYGSWTVGKDCPGDMEVNEPTSQVPVILTDDGPIIFEERPYMNAPLQEVCLTKAMSDTCTIVNNNEHFIDIPKKRNKSPKSDTRIYSGDVPKDLEDFLQNTPVRNKKVLDKDK